MNLRLIRLPRFVYATLAALAVLAALAFLTPQGRAFAQNAWHFFVRADGFTFPLRRSQVREAETDPAAPTAVPPAPLISVAEAEAQVGFDLAELPAVPEGLNYLGARLYGHAVSIEYETEGHGGHLVLVQSQRGYLQSEWDRVPADAIVPVKIGELDAEYAQGTFVVYAGETRATWNPEASILRLRWIEDGIWFEMTKFGDVHAIEYLDREAMIELAERLAIQP